MISLSTLFAALLACARMPVAPDPDLAPPAPWFYASTGDDIDRESIGFVGGEVRFRTIGMGLRSGSLEQGDRIAASLACGGTTHATLVVQDGKVVDVVTVPTVPCVQTRALETDLSRVELDGVRIADTRTALIVLDVPTEALCSR